MTDNAMCCGGACLDYGDFVVHRLNTDVFGLVVGRMGSTLMVRVSPSLAVLTFQECELRLAENDEYEPPESDEQEPGDSTIIDFTKERELRANTPTKGAA